MSPETAALLQKYMRNNVASVYGDNNFPGLTVCAKSGTAEVGGDKQPHAWFVGFIAEESKPYAVAVIVENAGTGAGVAVPIARQILEACPEIDYE